MSPQPSAPDLSGTSYAVLGLLCVSEWSAYDLVRQMERGWADTWPRAASGIYREPKKLVEHGYATERSELSGRRSRTVYAVTDAGRRAFREWLGTGCSEPKLEAEALLRVLFAEHGTKAELLAAIEGLGAYGRERSEALLRQGQEYLAGEAPFPDRLHVLQLVGGFHAFYLGALIQWSLWASAEVGAWQGTDLGDVSDVGRLTGVVADLFRGNLAAPPDDRAAVEQLPEEEPGPP